MATVSERAHAIADTIAREIDGNFIVSEKEIAATAGVIAAYLEQALLAERRLAMEFCAEIVRDYAFPVGARHSGTFNKALHEISEQLRAAAEKETGTR